MTTNPLRVERALARLDAMSSQAVITLAAFLGSVAVAVDLSTSADISLSILYVVPVSLVAWRLGRRPGLIAAIAAAAAWFAADLVNGPEYSQLLVPVWNGSARLAYFVISSTLAVVLRERTDDATHDALTGLLNRRGFMERADIEIARARRAGHGLTLAFADLDDLKQVNDSDGHAAGDAILREFGASAQRTIRHIDVAARVGGDEFAFLFPESTSVDADVIIERLHAIQTAGGARLRFSLGVVTFEVAPLDIDAALRRADQAMYRAKAAGGCAVSHEVVA